MREICNPTRSISELPGRQLTATPPPGGQCAVSELPGRQLTGSLTRSSLLLFSELPGRQLTHDGHLEVVT